MPKKKNGEKKFGRIDSWSIQDISAYRHLVMTDPKTHLAQFCNLNIDKILQKSQKWAPADQKTRSLPKWKVLNNYIIFDVVQAALVICGLFICDFMYMPSRNGLFSGTYPLIFSHPFYMRIRYMRPHFWSPYLSHITRSTCTIINIITSNMGTNLTACVGAISKTTYGMLYVISKW